MAELTEQSEAVVSVILVVESVSDSDFALDLSY